MRKINPEIRSWLVDDIIEKIEEFYSDIEKPMPNTKQIEKCIKISLKRFINKYIDITKESEMEWNPDIDDLSCEIILLGNYYENSDGFHNEVHEEVFNCLSLV